MTSKQYDILSSAVDGTAIWMYKEGSEAKFSLEGRILGKNKEWGDMFTPEQAAVKKLGLNETTWDKEKGLEAMGVKRNWGEHGGR